MKSTTLTASFLLTAPQSSERPVHPESKLRVVFFGTPAFAAEFLNGLLSDPYFDVVGVVSQPDEPQGRKKILTPPPVKALALEKCVPVFQPTKMRDPKLHGALKALQADVFVIVAYGRILPEAILSLPPLGCINVHPSLLPRFRGPSPMQAAISAGDQVTGVSVMQIDADMDHGPILAQKKIELASDETIETLTKKVVNIGVPLLLTSLKEYHQGNLEPTTQNHSEATYCKLLTKEDGFITWHESAEEIERKIRAYNPWPGTWTTWERNDEPLNVKIFSALISDRKLEPGKIVFENNRIFIGTSSTALEIIELQPAAGKRMKAADFIRGYNII